GPRDRGCEDGRPPLAVFPAEGRMGRDERPKIPPEPFRGYRPGLRQALQLRLGRWLPPAVPASSLRSIQISPVYRLISDESLQCSPPGSSRPARAGMEPCDTKPDRASRVEAGQKRQQAAYARNRVSFPGRDLTRENRWTTTPVQGIRRQGR